MARLANGTVTGQLDCRLGSIRVGDTVQCLADGLEYVVDGYCGIRNESGVAFKIKEWDPGKFRVVQSKVDGKLLAEAGGKKPAAEPEPPAEAETKAEQPPVAVTISPTLEDYSDERLRAELERRGFAGTLTKVVTLTLGA